MRRIIANFLSALCVVSFCAGMAAAQETKDAKAPQAIQPAEVKLGRPVDFERDVYPILDAKCVACHAADGSGRHHGGDHAMVRAESVHDGGGREHLHV